MEISLFCGAGLASIDAAITEVQRAKDHRFDGVLFAQGFGVDALTAIAVVGSRIPDIGLGTAVIPIQGRHPLPMALAALTTADAIGPERLTLGIGATHAVVSENVFAIPYKEMLERSHEQLIVLDGLLSTSRSANYDGVTVATHATLTMTTARPRLLLAALGPKMLQLAGSYADGTVTWMTGPTTITEQTLPALTRAADEAGRATPQVVAGLPICVTDHTGECADRLNDVLQGPAALPSYKRMLINEGVERPVDIALIGNEEQVAERLGDLRSRGVTEFLANILGTNDEQARTMEFLASSAARS